MKLYEFAVIFTSRLTKAQLEAQEKPRSELVVDVTRVLAHSDAEANMLAARAIPKQYEDKLDQCQIALRPF